ncbi:MAG: VOC family protein [Rhabdochlamydiaceae bacterium]|nr:VOC family protein [Candidatus Amphrikana amoebophyrae]
MNRLGNIIYYVKDVAKTVDFFEKAFGIERQFIDETGVYAQMKTGNTALGFAEQKFAQTLVPNGFTPLSPDKPFGQEISFCSDEPKEAYARAIECGCKEITPLKAKEWGQVVGHLLTPDGILVEIASEMEMKDE